MAKRPCRTIAGTRLAVTGLPSGPCGVRFFAPQTAAWMDARAARVEKGRLEFALPSFATNLAIVVSRLTPN